MDTFIKDNAVFLTTTLFLVFLVTGVSYAEQGNVPEASQTPTTTETTTEISNPTNTQTVQADSPAAQTQVTETQKPSVRRTRFEDDSDDDE